MDTIYIKVTNYSTISKPISIIRKYSKAPIGEIRSAIDQGKGVLEYSYLSHSGIRKIAKCYDELLKAGVTCEIYDEFEELISRDILSNLINFHKETEREVQEQLDEEADSEEDEA